MPWTYFGCSVHYCHTIFHHSILFCIKMLQGMFCACNRLLGKLSGTHVGGNIMRVSSHVRDANTDRQNFQKYFPHCKKWGWTSNMIFNLDVSMFIRRRLVLSKNSCRYTKCITDSNSVIQEKNSTDDWIQSPITHALFNVWLCAWQNTLKFDTLLLSVAVYVPQSN